MARKSSGSCSSWPMPERRAALRQQVPVGEFGSNMAEAGRTETSGGRGPLPQTRQEVGGDRIVTVICPECVQEIPKGAVSSWPFGTDEPAYHVGCGSNAEVGE